MAIDITNLGHVNNYFKAVSGFIPNKYLVDISGNGGKNIATENLSFYAKSVSIPQVKINTVSDIYVSKSSLARPKLPISAECIGEISITFRDDQFLSIYNKLQSFHNSLRTSAYEASGNFDNISISIKVFNNSTVYYSRVFNRCSLFDLVPLKVDASSRKFLEYEAVFNCNDMLDSLTYDDPNYIVSGSGVYGIVSCSELQQKYQEAVKKFNTYKIDSHYINKNSPRNELNNQVGTTQLGLPIVRSFNDSSTVEINARNNADIQISYFEIHIVPVIKAMRGAKCTVPPFPAIDSTYPIEAIYVKEGIRKLGYGFKFS